MISSVDLERRSKFVIADTNAETSVLSWKLERARERLLPERIVCVDSSAAQDGARVNEVRRTIESALRSQQTGARGRGLALVVAILAIIRGLSAESHGETQLEQREGSPEARPVLANVASRSLFGRTAVVALSRSSAA